MKVRSWALIIIWFLSIVWLYFTPRENFYFAWCIYSLAFGSYFLLLFTNQVSFKTGIALMIAIRGIGFLADPLMSDDYYRYIWDGWLSTAGIHPMAHTPAYIMEHPELIRMPLHLFEKLNSPEYYSVYPPLAQGMFQLSSTLNGPDIAGHLLFYKCLLTAVDVLIVYLLYHLLRQYKLPKEKTLLYALNPLVILEFTGNLHFDGLMIAGLAAAMLAYGRQSMIGTSLSLSFSVLTKIVTLITLPYILGRWPWKKMIVTGVLTLCCICIPFLIYAGKETGWIESIGLWFQRFEFNASIYYLVRWAGHQWKGYNLVQYLGPALAAVTMAGMLWLWVKYRCRKQMSLSTVLLHTLMLYFLMGTTVHPWYIAILLIPGILTQRVYPIAWTYLVFLSYSHYENGAFMENYVLISAEYILLFAFYLLEARHDRSKKKAPDVCTPGA